MSRWRVGALVAVALTSAGCKDVDKVQQELKETRKAFEKQLEETRGAIKETVDVVTDALPGGTWNKLTVDLHSGDEKKRREALDFLASFSGESRKAPYEVSIAFGFADSSRLHAAVFRAPTESRVHLVERVERNALNATNEVLNGLSLPADRETALLAVEQEFRAALDAMIGSAKIEHERNGQDEGRYALHWSGPLPNSGMAFNYGRNEFGIGPSSKDAAKSKAQEQARALQAAMATAAQHSRRALEKLYGSATLPMGNAVLKEDWELFDSNQYLFIAIPKDDWERHKNDAQFEIVASLHAKGEPTKTYRQRLPYRFARADFEANRPVPSERYGELMWAAQLIGDLSLFNEQSLRNLARLQELIAKWEDEKNAEAGR